MDGAHTHHHGPSGWGIGPALALGAGLALAASLASTVVAIVHLLLIALAIIGGLAFAALITWAVIAYRRQQAPSRLIPAPIAENREVVSLRQAITELHAQLYAARAAQLAAGQTETHRHLHLHGLTADQVAVILATESQEAGEGQ
jgi:hypothetical protein